jgi:hypothetical protein
MTIGNGQRALFWEDRWINGRSVSEMAPLLYACIPRDAAKFGQWLMVYKATNGRETSREF